MHIQGLSTLGGLVLSIQRFHLWRLRLDIYHNKVQQYQWRHFHYTCLLVQLAANFFQEHITHQFGTLTKLQATNGALSVEVLLYQAMAIPRTLFKAVEVPRTLFKVVVVPCTTLLESQWSYASHHWDLCKHHLTLKGLVLHYCWWLFFRPTWHYFIGNPCHINKLLIFWVNLFKTQNKLISHSTTWIGLTWPARSLLQEANSWSTNWDHNPTTLLTSTYGLGLSNKSKLTAHITSLTLMASSFFNKSPYLHKITTKLEVRHLIFGLWPKLISLFRETLGAVVWRVKRYVQ